MWAEIASRRFAPPKVLAEASGMIAECERSVKVLSPVSRSFVHPLSACLHSPRVNAVDSVCALGIRRTGRNGVRHDTVGSN